MRVCWMPKDDSDWDLFAEEFAIDPSVVNNGGFVNSDGLVTKY
jgi:hypothetical protein